MQPFLLHIHITLLVARRSNGDIGRDCSQYGWSVIGRIYLSVAALLIHITLLHLPSFKGCGHFGYMFLSEGWQISKGDTVEEYRSVAEVIDTHFSAPPTWKESHCFFGCGLCSFLFPDRDIYRGRDAYC